MAAVYLQLDSSYVRVDKPNEFLQPNPSGSANSLQLQLTIQARFQLRKHDCVPNTYQNRLHSRQTTGRPFDVDLLNDRRRALEILGPMLTTVGLLPSCSVFQRAIDKIINVGLERVNKLEASTNNYKGRSHHQLLPLRVEIGGMITEHRLDINECLLRRGLEESELEFERSNYGMVPANKSSVNKMLKRVIVVDDDDDDEDASTTTKRRRVSREDCLICLEHLEPGLDTSLMPCRHCFHSNCIEKWLNLSHYCPVCRFELPAL